LTGEDVAGMGFRAVGERGLATWQRTAGIVVTTTGKDRRADRLPDRG